MFYQNAQMIQALVESKQVKPLTIEETIIEVPNRQPGWRGVLANWTDTTIKPAVTR